MLNPVGLIILLITIGMVTIIGFIHPYIKKITNLYWFWLIIGIILLMYQLIFRFFNDFSKVTEALRKHEYFDSIIFSKGFLLDLCPFCSFCISIALIIDPSRKIANILSYFGIFGGLITYCGGFLINTNDTTTDAQWNWEWFYKGFYPNPMYFAIHFIQLFFCPWILLNKKQNFSFDIFGVFLFIILYFSYVIIIINIFHVYSNATGLVEYDWIEGEYSTVGKIFLLSFPYVCVLSFVLVSIFIISLTLIFNFIQKKCKKYRNDYTFKSIFLFNFK